MEEPCDDLYVMQYIWKGLWDNSSVKIGRSFCPETRRRSLESCQNFRVQLAAVFKGWGNFEHAVHLRLAHVRSSDGAGKEWFDVSVAEAVKEIAAVVLEEASERAPKRARWEDAASTEAAPLPSQVMMHPYEGSSAPSPDVFEDLLGDPVEDEDDEGADEDGEVDADSPLSTGVLRPTYRSALVTQIATHKTKSGNPMDDLTYRRKVHQLVMHYKVSRTCPPFRVRARLPELRDVFNREFGMLPFEVAA